jgi:hypothetical protein
MRPRKGKPHELGAAENGGLNAPPFCFVCSRVVDDVTMQRQLEARRGLNVAVWLASPGAHPRHPRGVVRHAYCAPMTARHDRWSARERGPTGPRGGLGAQAPGTSHGPLTDVPPTQGAGVRERWPTGPPRGLQGPDVAGGPQRPPDGPARPVRVIDDDARMREGAYERARDVLIRGALDALDLFSEDELEEHARMLRAKEVTS